MPIEPIDGKALSGVHLEGHNSNANAHTFRQRAYRTPNPATGRPPSRTPFFHFLNTIHQKTVRAPLARVGKASVAATGPPVERAGMFKIISDVD